MTIKKLKYSILLGIFVTIVSCDAEYLETSPQNSTSNETVFESTANAKLAINGIAKLMNRTYLGKSGYNGEGTIKMYYGNYPGNYFASDHTSRINQINQNYYDEPTNRYTYYPWYYYYKIISNANEIIARIDDIEGHENEKQYIKAQALGYRGYSYFNLLQLYGNRWQDSNNGAANGVVLRTEPSTDQRPVSSMGEVYNQIFADLNEAIQLFDASNYIRDKNYQIDKSVVQAMAARAYITRGSNQEDYQKAADFSRKARESYPLMSVADYNAGFANPTSEWIWSVFDSAEETTGSSSFFCYIGYIGQTSDYYKRPKIMTRDLYEQIPETDIRRDLFLDPKGMDYDQRTGEATKKKHPELYNYAFEHWPDMYSKTMPFAYMSFKFRQNELPGVGHLNNFRSSEMYLIEAEAEYFLKNDTKAQEILEELIAGSNRDPEYVSTKTGEELFQEIKMYRAVELWGEGFDWFDLKRWADPVDRKNVENGGSFFEEVAIYIGPDEKRKWTWMIPNIETDYNSEIN